MLLLMLMLLFESKRSNPLVFREHTHLRRIEQSIYRLVEKVVKEKKRDRETERQSCVL
jgi:hypothetical protein